MSIVFMLIEVEAGKIAAVLSELKDIKGVVESYAITGPFDIHIKIKARSLEEIKELIERIQRIEGVERTLSSMVLPY
ncbi:MAG: Lrp/AsnC family transcriptional regulator [Candidatus Odinarchaeia archaeon]